MVTFGRTLATMALAASLLVLGSAGVSAATKITALPSASHLPCGAGMNSHYPPPGSTDVLHVASWGGVAVRAYAHFKSGTVVREGRTGAHGNVRLNYWVSTSPLLGYEVIVDIYVSKGSTHSFCRTFFIPTAVARTSAWCTASAQWANDGWPGDYYVSVSSNQPYSEATATDSTDSWSDETNGSGYVRILLYHTFSGERIDVKAGATDCTTTA